MAKPDIFLKNRVLVISIHLQSLFHSQMRAEGNDSGKAKRNN